VTPFTSDVRQEIDEERLRELMNFLNVIGVHGLVTFGVAVSKNIFPLSNIGK